MSITNSLNTGLSALRSFTRGIEVIGDNIANMSTTGFKKGRADYSDSFSQLLGNPQSGELNTPFKAASNLGSGVKVTGISTDFSTEQAQYTGQESDLAISGNGFFRVQDATGNELITRAGNFKLDTQGYLVTPHGYRVIGDDAAGGVLQVPSSATANGLEQTVINWGFTEQTGILQLTLADGSTVNNGRISLARFTEPGALIRKGSNIYQETTAAGRQANFNPSSSEAATVQSKFLELSNVDITEEFAGMITTQRGFQAGARIITTADQLMQEAIQLKR